MKSDYKGAYLKMAEFGQELLKHPELSDALPIIADYAREVLNVERCSIWMHYPRHGVLWTRHSDGIEKIVMQKDKGVAGYAFKKMESVLVNDPYHDERFVTMVDQTTGFTTRNMICVPVLDSMRLPIGVFQVLNKTDGDFDEDDVRFATFFANFISGYLELSNIVADDVDILNDGIVRTMVGHD